MDLYTHFTADQTRHLLISARKGTRSMLKYLEETFPNDYADMIFAIADCMPQLVAEDRVYKSGPRKGQRKVVFWNSGHDISSIVSEELTGCATIQEFTRAHDYCGVYNGSGKSMVETVLAPPVNDAEYAKHWIKTYLDDKATGFPNLKTHYLKMTQSVMDRAQAAVDAWLEANPQDMEELMTWDSAKYNEWHFGERMKKAA